MAVITREDITAVKGRTAERAKEFFGRWREAPEAPWWRVGNTNACTDPDPADWPEERSREVFDEYISRMARPSVTLNINTEMLVFCF